MKKIFLIISSILLLVSGCGTTLQVISPPSFPTSTLSTPVAQPQAALTLIKLNPNSFKVSAEYSAQAKTVQEWASSGEEMLINGGYFNEDYTPSGYLIVNSQRIGKRIFDQDKSGIFGFQNEQVVVRDLKTDPLKTGEKFDFAVQSYPFLIEDGKPAIKTISDKRARRTAVGIDKEKNLYIIIVDQKELSLYEFMQELINTKIPFVQVLNLDGGPSTGLYSTWKGEEKILNSYFPVPNIIRFTKK
jgi:uncharacterized protein YigE (DUF2233 family)